MMTSPKQSTQVFWPEKTPFLKRALNHLSPTELVGAAHWCDEGGAAIDAEPDHTPDAALLAINSVVSAPPIKSKKAAVTPNTDS